MIAWRPTSWKAMFCAEWRAAVAMGIARDDAVGIERRPLQHLHPAHRAAGDAEQLLDAERVEQHRLGAHHVAHGDEREVEPVGLAGRGIDLGRPARAHAAAEDIGADDEEAVGVDRLAGADHHGHQPGLPVTGLSPMTNWSPRQRVADQDRVRARRVERAVGHVGARSRAPATRPASSASARSVPNVIAWPGSAPGAESGRVKVGRRRRCQPNASVC